MKYLADVNVLSEPTKTQAEPKVVQWLQENHAEIVVDPIVMGELWEGIVSLPDGRRKRNLVEWFGRSPTGLSSVSIGLSARPSSGLNCGTTCAGAASPCP